MQKWHEGTVSSGLEEQASDEVTGFRGGFEALIRRGLGVVDQTRAAPGQKRGGASKLSERSDRVLGDACGLCFFPCCCCSLLEKGWSRTLGLFQGACRTAHTTGGRRTGKLIVSDDDSGGGGDGWQRFPAQKKVVPGRRGQGGEWMKSAVEVERLEVASPCVNNGTLLCVRLCFGLSNTPEGWCLCRL